jgi:hypothetical protein
MIMSQSDFMREFHDLFLAEQDGIYRKIIQQINAWFLVFLGTLGLAIPWNVTVLMQASNAIMFFVLFYTSIVMCAFSLIMINRLIVKKHLLFLHRQREFFNMLLALDIVVEKNRSKYSPVLTIISVPETVGVGNDEQRLAARKRVLDFIQLTHQSHNHLRKFQNIVEGWLLAGACATIILLLISMAVDLPDLSIYPAIIGVPVPFCLNLILSAFETKYNVILGADMARWPPLRGLSPEKLNRRMQKVLEIC